MTRHWDKPRGVEYDLHNHTDLSKDGKIPGRRLIDFARRRGLKGLGICEHDAFPDQSLRSYARQRGMELALGVEFSCRRSHVIGFGLNPSPEDRRLMEERFALYRSNIEPVTREILKRLGRVGIRVSYDELRDYAGKQPQKVFLLKYLAEEMGLFPSWCEARQFLNREGLYLADNHGLTTPHPAEAVELIRRNGGTAIWAHPFFTPEPLRAAYLQDMVEAGLDGVEVVYAYRQNGYQGPESNSVLEARMLAMLGDLDLALSGGSDSHYPVKTDDLLRPIMPGDAGITGEDARRLSRIFE